MLPSIFIIRMALFDIWYLTQQVSRYTERRENKTNLSIESSPVRIQWFILLTNFTRHRYQLPSVLYLLTLKHKTINSLHTYHGMVPYTSFFHLVHSNKFLNFHCTYRKIGSHTEWIVQISNRKSKTVSNVVIDDAAALLTLRHDLFFLWHQKWKARHSCWLVG